MIGIIGALKQEVNIMINKMENVLEEEVLGNVFYCGELLKNHIVISECSIGKVNAAIAASAMIIKYNPNIIINTGIAGSLDKKVKIMDVVIADKISIHDESDVFKKYYPFIISFNTSKEFVNMAKIAYNEIYRNLNRLYIGEVITGDSFVDDNIKKEMLKTDFYDSLAVDMECGAIAKVCYRSKKDLIVIKTISDEANDMAKTNYNDFIDLAAQKSSAIVLQLLRKLSFC